MRKIDMVWIMMMFISTLPSPYDYASYVMFGFALCVWAVSFIKQGGENEFKQRNRQPY